MKPRYAFWLLPLWLLSCARMGQPSGGDKDTTPPKVTAELPPSGTVNFSGKQIVIKFDELIQLDNPLQKVVFSPPLAVKPDISPVGYPAREIRIRFKAPLPAGRTYAIRFGDAIKDYHEGNVLQDYTYVFSTGPALDSLKLTGKVIPTSGYDLPGKTFAGLYPAENFSDSLIYRQAPYYLARVDAKSGRFTLDHLKAGSYVLVAFSDKNGNLTYQPHDEQIGFVPQAVQVPTDSVFQIPLFAETRPFALENISEKSAGHWIVKFKGSAAGIEIETPGRRLLHYVDGENLHLWLRPARKGDTLHFVFRRGKDTLAARRVKASLPPVDTLVFQWDKKRLYPVDSLRLLANVPLTGMDVHKILVTPKRPGDSITLNRMGLPVFRFGFDEERSKAEIRILPGALTGFNGLANTDTLKTTVDFVPARETGNYTLVWPGAPKGHLIAELTGLKGEKIFRRLRVDNGRRFAFPYLLPGKYRLRFVRDTNGNGRWDTGSWKGRRLPEPVIVYPKIIEIRANWDVEEKFQSTGSSAPRAPAGLRNVK